MIKLIKDCLSIEYVINLNLAFTADKCKRLTVFNIASGMIEAEE